MRAPTRRRPPRIEKKKITWKRKRDLRHKPEHLAFIRQLCCASCGKPPPNEAAHVRIRGGGTGGGTGYKPADQHTIPLCARCHYIQHYRGELTFYNELGIDPIALTEALYRVTGYIEAGNRILFRARQEISLKRN